LICQLSERVNNKDVLLLNRHIKELKKDSKNEGLDLDSALFKQITRLTQETIRQHHEIKKLKSKLSLIYTSINDSI